MYYNISQIKKEGFLSQGMNWSGPSIMYILCACHNLQNYKSVVPCYVLS